MADKQPVSLAKHRAKKTATPKPQPFPLKIVLVLMVDGEAKSHIGMDAEIATPPGGEGVQVVFPVDARALAQVLEQVVGPSKAAQLWTPGAKPVRLAQD